MRAHALSQGLVYGTGILIVIDSLDAIAGGSSDVVQVGRGGRGGGVHDLCVCDVGFVVGFCCLFFVFVF